MAKLLFYVCGYFFLVQGEGRKGRALLKSIRKVISHHEIEGIGSVEVGGSTQLALIPPEQCGAPADRFGEASSCHRP